MSRLVQCLGIGILIAIGSDAPLSAQEARSFTAPSVNGVRLDWCKHWARDCGKPAADLFCQQNGFQRATQFAIDANVGMRGVRTLVFGDGSFCQNPTCSSFRIITCERTLRADTEDKSVIGRPLGPPPTDKDKKMPAFIPGLQFAPIGGELFQCWFGTECTRRDVAIEPAFERKVVPFQANVKNAKANAILWQISDRPFPPFQANAPATLNPPGLVGSGRVDIGQVQGQGYKAGSFVFDFTETVKKLPAPAGQTPKATYHVRALPLAASNSSEAIDGPTNVIKVAYGYDLPQKPSGPLTIYTEPGPRRPDPLFRITIESFTPPVFEKPSKWGCVIVTGYKPGTPGLIKDLHKDLYKLNQEYCPPSYRGEGNQVDSVGEFFEHMAGKITGAWDWLGDKFDELKEAAVNIAMTYTGLTALCSEAGIQGTCKEVASAALNTGLVAVGVPPSLPSYNELIDRGVESAVAVAAQELESATGYPCPGPCRDALRAGVNEFADKVKRHAANPGCVGTEEAHKRGREPLCVPDFVEARPAPGAVYTPPILMVRVTRRPEIPAPAKGHPKCTVSVLEMVVKNFFAGGRVSFHACTGCPIKSKQVPPQPIQATLFHGASPQPIPLDLAPGKSIVIPVAYDRIDRFVFSWTKELNAGSQFEIRPAIAWDDWMTIYRGGNADLRAGSNCATEPSRRTFALPRG